LAPASQEILCFLAFCKKLYCVALLPAPLIPEKQFRMPPPSPPDEVTLPLMTGPLGSIFLMQIEFLFPQTKQAALFVMNEFIHHA